MTEHPFCQAGLLTVSSDSVLSLFAAAELTAAALRPERKQLLVFTSTQPDVSF